MSTIFNVRRALAPHPIKEMQRGEIIAALLEELAEGVTDMRRREIIEAFERMGLKP